MSDQDTSDDGDLDDEERQVVSRLDATQIETIDRTLLENTSVHWRKMAAVVATTMASLVGEKFSEVPDIYLAVRIRMFVTTGAIEAVGNPRRMRGCEIRRLAPRDASDTVEAKRGRISPIRSKLISAIEAGDLVQVRELVPSRVAVDEPDGYGWLPIHCAAANDRVEVISFLIEQGSPLECRGTDDWTALHLASVRGRSRAVDALVGAGADVNSTARKGNTPLHLALIAESREIIETLIRAGANRTIQDSEGRTPTAVAREQGLTDLAELLEMS
jgi:Ankyrin repeats (3 copies)/Protein of unknown function/Ankyrin repeat